MREVNDYERNLTERRRNKEFSRICRSNEIFCKDAVKASQKSASNEIKSYRPDVK